MHKQWTFYNKLCHFATPKYHTRMPLLVYCRVIIIYVPSKCTHYVRKYLISTYKPNAWEVINVFFMYNRVTWSFQCPRPLNHSCGTPGRITLSPGARDMKRSSYQLAGEKLGKQIASIAIPHKFGAVFDEKTRIVIMDQPPAYVFLPKFEEKLGHPKKWWRYRGSPVHGVGYTDSFSSLVWWISTHLWPLQSDYRLLTTHRWRTCSLG